MTINTQALRKGLVSILGMTPSDEQLAAIEAPLKPGLIVAGAGTGDRTGDRCQRARSVDRIRCRLRNHLPRR